MSRLKLDPHGSHLTSSALVGSIEPRLWTPPLRELTPATSYGFRVIDFADRVLDEPLDPWQKWLVIHGGERLADGRPRFRIVVVVVARQNGKTHVLVVLSLYWLYLDLARLILGTSTNLDYARESWEKAVALVEGNPALVEEIPPRGGVRRANGEQTLTTTHGCRYKIAASNRRGGRSLTIHRLILDELREHHSREAWDAAVPAMNAVADAQAWAITNQGDDKSVVLNQERSAALEYIETGVGDPRVGLFEWSAPDGSDPEDPAAIAAANPNLNAGNDHAIDLDSILGEIRRAKVAGGETLAGVKTEILCMRVPVLDPAFDAEDWRACEDPAPYDEGSRLALVVDVSLDAQHATLYSAAQQADGRIRVDAVTAWAGPHCTRELRAELRDRVIAARPKVFGWMPNGPAAAIAAELAEGTAAGWPPRGIKVQEIRRDLNAVCMGAADLVRSHDLAHGGDPLLTAHVLGASKLWVGDGWRYTRKGSGHVDAAYAFAGAVHLARTLLKPRKPLLVIEGGKS